MIRDIVIFKNEIKTYTHYLKQRSINKEYMDGIDDQLCNIKSPSPKYAIVKKRIKTGMENGKPVYKVVSVSVPEPKVRSNFNKIEKRRLELIEQKSDFEYWYNYYDRKIKDIENTLDTFPNDFKTMCIDVFVKRKARKVADSTGYTVQGLYWHIDAQLKKYLKIK